MREIKGLADFLASKVQLAKLEPGGDEMDYRARVYYSNNVTDGQIRDWVAEYFGPEGDVALDTRLTAKILVGNLSRVLVITHVPRGYHQMPQGCLIVSVIGMWPIGY